VTTIRVATYNAYLGADLIPIFEVQNPEHLRQGTRGCPSYSSVRTTPGWFAT
jgi:hypothetical protein